jgi:hypothetical protein
MLTGPIECGRRLGDGSAEGDRPRGGLAVREQNGHCAEAVQPLQRLGGRGRSR